MNRNRFSRWARTCRSRPRSNSSLGYGTVRGCYFGKLGHVDHKSIVSENGETFDCDVDHFDAERDIFPYADASFDTVLCCELIEHLSADPMHMMSEINRILKPGGHLRDHHAQSRFPARDLGDSAGLSSVVLSRIHPPAEGRRGSRSAA